MAAVVFCATGEAALRIIYRDAGKRTLGAPGGRLFEHLTIHDEQRGRMDVGPKGAKPRIMIVGDSITWGQGVRDWQETWPEQLALALERGGSPHELAVFALPGRDIPAHVQEVERSIAHVQPDVFIYQWYVNDIEVEPRRPRNTRWWQTWAGHDTLRAWSYLYYFLDNRLLTYLPAPDRSYVDYILQDYAPGSLEWSEFERYFHTLATQAMAARTRLLVVYPQVPFRGTSPLQPIYDRVIALAGPHRLVIPPVALVRYAGELTTRAERPAVMFAVAPEGPALETRNYYFSPGDHEIDLTVSIDATVPTFGTLELIDAATNERLSTAPLSTSPGDWRDVTVQVVVPERSRSVRLRISGNGRTAFSVAQVAVPVDYGFEVVDLTAALNTFNTHTSIFDAHPNERAHQLIAEKVLERLQKSGSRH